jgi:hypothetical protein
VLQLGIERQHRAAQGDEARVVDAQRAQTIAALRASSEREVSLVALLGRGEPVALELATDTLVRGTPEARDRGVRAEQRSREAVGEGDRRRSQRARRRFVGRAAARRGRDDDDRRRPGRLIEMAKVWLQKR